MKKIIFILILSFAFGDSPWCGTVNHEHRNFERIEYTFPQIMDSTHFRVHFTLDAVDSTFWNDSWMTHQSTNEYATTVLEQLEFTYSIYQELGWSMPPIDCDESITDINNNQHCSNYGGNNLYDVYIGLVQGPAAAVVPENPNITLPYTGGLSSYMLFANGLGLYGSYDDLASINYYIIAHEVHHAIEFSYGSYITGSPGSYVFHSWMLEQSATFMENIVYPNAFHLRILLSNCNIETPLTSPQLGIYQSYPGALWQKFLVDYLNDDLIIRRVWESYGNRITNQEDPITFFDIFNDEIMFSSNNTYNIEKMYSEYAKWRYFTGDRSLSNQYFDEANSYCTSSTLEIPSNTINLQLELGGNRYINIPNYNFIIDLESEFFISVPATLIEIDHNNNIIFSDFDLTTGSNSVNIDPDFHYDKALIITSGYSGNEINFGNIIIKIDIIGDINQDGVIDILDIISLVDFILLDDYSLYIDLNEDGLLNIIDIVQLVSLILAR